MSFWQHLDVLRGSIIRAVAATVGCGIVAFILKAPLFKAILWPTKASFPLWRLMPLTAAEANVSLINTELTQQFVVHVEMALVVGALMVSPYILYELVRFVSPALYPHERKAARPAVLWGYLMFMAGVALAYLLIFPVTFRFLAGYQVEGTVANMITLRSYVSTLLVLSVLLGIVFELPVVCDVLARLGILTSAPMKRYRRHAIVAILVVAAIITPTGDAFTLSLVSLPIYLLYELSIQVVRRVEKRHSAE